MKTTTVTVGDVAKVIAKESAKNAAITAGTYTILFGAAAAVGSFVNWKHNRSSAK